MKRILVPPAPGLFSAFGLLYADVEHHYSRTFRRVLVESDPVEIDRAWRALEDEGRAQLAHEEFPVELVKMVLVAEGLPDAPVVPDTLHLDRSENGSGGGSRNAYFGPDAGWLETPVVRRSDLAGRAAGPLIVEEYDATCFVPPPAPAPPSTTTAASSSTSDPRHSAGVRRKPRPPGRVRVFAKGRIGGRILPFGYERQSAARRRDAGCGRCRVYSSIRISGYRGLDSFRMDGLGRINLLVGTNNCGKTSILECIELLRSSGNRYVLSSILGRRGEYGYSGDEDGQAYLEVRHLFANHDLGRDVVIEADLISTANVSSWNNRVSLSVNDRRDGELELDHQDQMEEDKVRFLRMDWSETTDEFKARLTAEGFLPMPGRLMRVRNGSNKAVQFIGTNGIPAIEVIRLFDDLVLTEDEEHVTEALRMVEPRIERIASVASERWPLFREAPSGVFLKLEGVAERIPIGSAGDGMWRMLGLALALANAKGGVLLVEEIDTGLHYSVMGDMWRMVGKRAVDLDVQVFATTHSRDCYQSLATIVEPESPSSQVTIQRIDPRRGQAVGFSDDDTVIAAERGIEVR